MKKYLLALPLVLSIISCKEIKIVKGPDGKTSLCTVSNMPGVAQGTPSANLQCVVLSCDAGFTKYDIQNFLNRYNTERSSCLEMYSETPYWCMPEVSPEITQYVADYPKICTPAAQACEGDNESYSGIKPGQGQRPWDGLEGMFEMTGSVSEDPQVEAGLNIDEATPQEFVNLGYSRMCQPKDSTSCQEGYVYIESNLQPRGTVENAIREGFSYKACVQQQQPCYIFEGSHITGYIREFDAQIQEYGSCMVTSCEEGYSIVENSCQIMIPPPTDPCLLNPQSNPACPGYNMCLAMPMMPGCPGYNPCLMNPMDPMCL